MAKIQDRVQKLLNMAKDASSPNEAMIAMERARSAYAMGSVRGSQTKLRSEIN